MERDEIIAKICAMQQFNAKLRAYRDVIAYIEKYEGTLQRKLSDATKKKEKLARSGKSNNGYYAALNDTVLLNYQIKEAMQLRLTLSEFALQISEESEKAGHDITDMVEKEEAESSQSEGDLEQSVSRLESQVSDLASSQKALSESIQALEDAVEEGK